MSNHINNSGYTDQEFHTLMQDLFGPEADKPMKVLGINPDSSSEVVDLHDHIFTGFIEPLPFDESLFFDAKVVENELFMLNQFVSDDDGIERKNKRARSTVEQSDESPEVAVPDTSIPACSIDTAHGEEVCISGVSRLYALYRQFSGKTPAERPPALIEKAWSEIQRAKDFDEIILVEDISEGMLTMNVFAHLEYIYRIEALHGKEAVDEKLDSPLNRRIHALWWEKVPFFHPITFSRTSKEMEILKHIGLPKEIYLNSNFCKLDDADKIWALAQICKRTLKGSLIPEDYRAFKKEGFGNRRKFTAVQSFEVSFQNAVRDLLVSSFQQQSSQSQPGSSSEEAREMSGSDRVKRSRN